MVAAPPTRAGAPAPPQSMRRVVVTGPRDDLVVTAPFTGAEVGRVPSCDGRDVEEAIARARATQPAWAARPVAQRARVLARFHDLVLERRDEVLDLIQLESGKVRAHAFEEVLDAALVAAYYAAQGPRHIAPRRRRGALPLLTSTTEVRHPKGVVGFITPWNYPLSMAITDAIPALLAGNACVIKPAQQTPLTALWAIDLMMEAGVPDDVLLAVTGRGSVIGGPLIDGVDFVTFTGSTATGRTVAQRAGEALIGCALELGGKNPLLVLDDADLDAAVRGAVTGCFASAGQLCISIERILVHRTLFDEFTARLVSAVRRLELSAALDYTGDVGSLVSEDQLATVTRHVEDAVARGATVLAGGRARPDVGPLFFEPTVLTGVTPAMAAYDEETFGPVVSLYPVGSDEEAIALANATPYGLNASVWTRDTARGRAVAARLQAGTVNVNDAYAAAWGSVDAPMGGFKDSGLGRRHGRDGIWKYTEVQTIAVQRAMPVTGPSWVPARLADRLLPAVLRLLHRLPVSGRTLPRH